MNTTDYAQTILEEKGNVLIFGSWRNRRIFNYTAYKWKFYPSVVRRVMEKLFDMNGITEHLEAMCDNANHHGLVFFVFILANAANSPCLIKFTEMSAKDSLVSILSEVIIEDWPRQTHEHTRCTISKFLKRITLQISSDKRVFIQLKTALNNLNEHIVKSLQILIELFVHHLSIDKLNFCEKTHSCVCRGGLARVCWQF